MKRVFSYALVVCMISVMLIASVSAANKFDDVSGHWAEKYITYLSDKSILNGYEENGTFVFKPDGTVTRAEFIKMMTETFGLKETTTLYYYDVSASDWYYSYISKAAAQGFLLDYGYSINASEQLTREEAAALLARYLDLSDMVDTSYYSDYYDISTKYAKYVLQATNAGLFNGYDSDGKFIFQPQKTLTRAEALTILYRAAGSVYSSTASGRDSGANDQNAVITNSGITISDVTLGGNVYITEGASDGKVVLSGVTINGTLFIRSSGEVTLTNCSATNVVVEPGDSSTPTIRLYGSTKINNVSLTSAANIEIDSKATVSDMTVTMDAAKTKITGTGTLSNLRIYASGVESSIVPKNYTIDSVYTAVFGGAEYTKDGPVAVGTGFVDGYPYITEAKDGYAYLTFKTEKTGTIYYTLVSKKSSTPDAKSIKADGYSVSAKTKETEADINYKYTKFEDYDLAVVYYNENGVAFDPVRIFRSEDSGFYSATVKGSSSGGDYTATYTLTSHVPGTAYIVAYRTDKTDSLTDSKVISYASSSNSNYIAGAVLDMPVGGTAYYYDLEIPSSYSSYDWETVVIFKTSTGVQQAACYAEIASSKQDLSAKKPIEGNGFIYDPELESGYYSYPYNTSSYDTISFKTEEDGKIYYYYTNTSTAPSSSNFYTNYKSATYSSYMSVTGNKLSTEELDYLKSQVSSYNYIVFSYCDSNGNYYEPVIVTRSSSSTNSGFSVAPTVEIYNSSIDKISFKPSCSGTLYYYYTSSSSVSASTFDVSKAESMSITAYTTETFYASASYSYVAFRIYDGTTWYTPTVVARGSSGSSSTTGSSSTYVSGYVSSTYAVLGYDTLVITPTSYANRSGKVNIYFSPIQISTVADLTNYGFSSSSVNITSDSATVTEWYLDTSSYYIYLVYETSSGTKYAPVLAPRL